MFKLQVASKVNPFDYTSESSGFGNIDAAPCIVNIIHGGVARRGVTHEQALLQGNHLHHLAALCSAGLEPCPWSQAHL